MGKDVKRLYSQFKPNHYKIELNPDRESKTFTGKVTVSGIKSGRPSKRFTFHQKDLSIKKAVVIKHDKKAEHNIAISRINLHKKFDEVRLHSENLIYPGSYTVELEFSGTITQAMNGIYPCLFELEGKSHELIATQFESHYAREVFPCIDEPEAKATFDLTLTTPKGETVLANTSVKSQIAKNDFIKSTFETTPKMSTYLLAFAYGKLDFLESKTKDGVIVRTYATPENAKFTKFALDIAVKTLDFYNQYFDLSLIHI